MAASHSLIATLAIAFGYALILGVIATRVGLPALVGYLVAGIIVGPFTPGFVADTTLAPQLAEIGVIFLMFGVGTHFSLRDLLAVWTIAVPGAIAQIVVATALGAAAALYWGFSLEAALVFGLALSVASTVVLLGALQAAGGVDTRDGKIAVGWLIVEDIVMVVALVLLPALARTQSTASDAGAMALALGLALLKVAGFSALMLVAGARVMPWIFAHVDRLHARELMVLAGLAAALGIAYGASELFDVSFALGAFLAGVVLNGSPAGHRVATYLVPFRDAFAVLFFVGVGMAFEPSILVRRPLEVAVTTAIIVLGKSLAAFLIALALRRPVSTALRVAAALAQIGEFSFIIVAMATSLGVLPAEGRSLILGGALLSILLNPFVFKAAEAVAGRLDKRA